MNRKPLLLVTLGLAGLAAAGCASMDKPIVVAPVADAIAVPASAKPYLDTLGVGEITYECREAKDSAGKFEWAFVGPVATLTDPSRKTVGKYYAGPTWEATDGSKVTGKQVAVSPSPNPKSIPLQLVKVDSPPATGTLSGTSYIQRLDTRMGVAPSTTCDASNKAATQKVAYEARYVFYR